MAIHKAKNSEKEETFGSLRLPLVERDKLSPFMPLFLKFIAALPTKSGSVL